MVARLKVVGKRFIDEAGCEVYLRGVNLGGSTKMPPTEPTHIANTFSQHRAVSFVGRPFPLAEAHEHLNRLRHLGFNLLRFLVTWEAIEHAGRGIYDEDYLNYVAEVVRLAGDYGFYVFIDPHQDVWSRMTGGDGAPGWTLEAVGFDLATLDLSEAAITMQRRYPDYPTMVWTDNYSRLACMTMFTLFFCGDKFAPTVLIEGLSVQTYLQGAFIAAIQVLAERLKGLPHVLGYGPMNEPGKGFIGLKSLDGTNGFGQRLVDLTAKDALFLGGGVPREVTQLRFEGYDWIADGTTMLNPHGISAWRGPDVWRELGVWDIRDGEPVVLRDDYFADADFLEDGLIPFMQNFAQAIRQVDPAAIIFVESTPTEAQQFQLDGDALAPLVNASHWYDEQMLFTRQFDGTYARDLTTGALVHGRAAVQAAFNNNIGMLVQASAAMGGVPTLIGEFGLSYDINAKRAFADGDYAMHELALSMYYTALDEHLAHSAQWNYTADNSNQWGDNWNGEDLSIFSRDQQTNPSDVMSGVRAARGFCRPRVVSVAGTVISQRFDYDSGEFMAIIDNNPTIKGATVLYLPTVWYPNGHNIEISGGDWQITTQQWLTWSIEQAGRYTIRIHPH